MNQQYRPQGFRILPLVIKNLLIINGIFFLATITVQRYGIDLADYLGMHYIGSDKFQPFQFITYMFMHSTLSYWHILGNMFALWMFGSAIENTWGAKRFLIFYMVTGIGAAIIQTLVQWVSFSNLEAAYIAYTNAPSIEAFEIFISENFKGYYNPDWYIEFMSNWRAFPGNYNIIQQSVTVADKLIQMKMNIPTVGASGAVFGILLAFGMMFPNSLIYVSFVIPLKAKWFVMIYGAFELYAGIAANPGDNVAHFAHLGGMIFGFILIKYWNKKSNKSQYF